MIPSGSRWGTATRLKDQMARLFGCTVGYKVENDSSLHMAQARIARKVYLWRDPKQPEQITVWNSHVVLDQDFFAEIIRNPVPVDMRALTALKRSRRWRSTSTSAHLPAELPVETDGDHLGAAPVRGRVRI